MKGRGFQTVIKLASGKFAAEVNGFVSESLELGGRKYESVRFGIIDDLCADLVLGHQFLSKHSEVVMEFGGADGPLRITKGICNVMAAKVNDFPRIFNFNDGKIKPIATKSRRYSVDDRNFICSEVEKWMESGIIEPSVSPWRAQVLVVNEPRHKKRLVIDYQPIHSLGCLSSPQNRKCNQRSGKGQILFRY